ncbi:MAG: EamA family transporter [Anaeromyxobacteraceae bacterium]
MRLVAAALLVGSALLHASWNALLKREREPRRAVVGVLGAALAIAAAAALADPAPAFATRAAFGWAVGAGALEGVYFATLAAALAGAGYGAVYAVARGGAMLVVWPAAPLLLAEPVTASGVAGAALVAVGLVLVTAAGSHAWRSPRALPFALACAASIAGYHLCYDRALHAGARPAPLFAVALAVAGPFVRATAPARGPASAALRPADVARWGVAGLVCTGSFLLFLAGLAATGAAAALTVRNTSILFAQAISAAMGERPGPRQLAGSVAIAVGATLVLR